jgi:hypothetical protein
MERERMRATQTEMAFVEPVKKARDWVQILAPTLLAVAVSLAINIGGYIWFMASLQMRVTNMEMRQKEQDVRISALPHDYVPRVEAQRTEEASKEQRVDDRARLDRIEAKVDLLLERRAGK